MRGKENNLWEAHKREEFAEPRIYVLFQFIFHTKQSAEGV